MKGKRAKRALRQVARNNRVSVDTVRREIELAIEEAQASSDPDIQAFWKSVPRKGDKLTSEEMIAYIANMIEHE